VARPKEFDPEAALASAMQLFRSKSYASVTTAELCDSMGIGRQSLYDTFGDKASVYRAALLRYRTESGRIVDSCLDRASVLAGLQSLFDSIADDDIENARCGCMIVNAVGELASMDIDVANIAEANQRRLLEVFSDTIRRGQLLGEIAANLDPHTAAAQLLTTFYGLRVVAKVAPGSPAVAGVAAHALDALR
jgi:TetR/AcrR family transcriptional regulator, transcriptional repressor for nem operon